jgi:hypothetical protein
MKKEFSSENRSDDDNTEDEIDDNLEDEIDPDYLKYIQNDFQDTIIDEIFYEIAEYIRENAIPLCEFMTRDDIEVLIDSL